MTTPSTNHVPKQDATVRAWIASLPERRLRLLVTVPVAAMIGLLHFESGGGMLILVAWLAAAAVTLAQPTRRARTRAEIGPPALKHRLLASIL